MATATKSKKADTKNSESTAVTVYQLERVAPGVPIEQKGPTATGVMRRIPLSKIDVAVGNRDQSAFTKERLASLVFSIGKRGLRMPIVVKEHGDRFLLIAGERRMRACMLLGWLEIPACIANDATLEDRLAENIDREALTFAEEADQVEHLYTEALAADKSVDALVGKQQADNAIVSVANRLGRSPYWVRERLMLAGLDDKIREAVIAGELSISVARKLAQIECREDRAAAAKAIGDRYSKANVAYRGLPTTEEINRIIGEYLYRLQGVKWRLDQPFAGKPACDTCEHNSNNSLWRFEQLTKDGKPIGSYREGAARSEGVLEERAVPKEGVCSNGACYRVKAEQAKAEVDRAAARAVTHLSRQAEASLGAKASPRKVAEQALLLSKRASVTAGLVPEGISGAAVLERVKPKLERLSQSSSHSGGTAKKTSDAGSEKKKQENREAVWKAERAAKEEYAKIAEDAIKQVQAPMLAELAKDTTRALIVEMVAGLPAVQACCSFDKRARVAALKRRELDETLSIIAMEPAKALRAIATIRFGKTGLGNHNPLGADQLENSMAYYETEFIAVMQRICKLLGVEIPDVTLEDEAVFVKRRTDELLNPKTVEEAQAPKEKRTPKVAPARKSGSARARVPDTADEEEPPRGQGDVDRDEENDE